MDCQSAERMVSSVEQVNSQATRLLSSLGGLEVWKDIPMWPWRSRTSKDSMGNNTMHFQDWEFMMQDGYWWLISARISS